MTITSSVREDCARTWHQKSYSTSRPVKKHHSIQIPARLPGVRSDCGSVRHSAEVFDCAKTAADETTIVLSPDKDIGYFRKLAKVSSVAKSLTEESADYRLLVRTNRDWLTFQFWRDRSETKDGESEKKNRALLASLADYLGGGVRNHRRDLSQVQSELIRGFLEQRYETMEQRLTNK